MVYLQAKSIQVVFHLMRSFLDDDDHVLSLVYTDVIPSIATPDNWIEIKNITDHISKSSVSGL
jgi:hypothetical protein